MLTSKSSADRFKAFKHPKRFFKAHPVHNKSNKSRDLDTYVLDIRAYPICLKFKDSDWSQFSKLQIRGYEKYLYQNINEKHLEVSNDVLLLNRYVFVPFDIRDAIVSVLKTTIKRTEHITQQSREMLISNHIRLHHFIDSNSFKKGYQHYQVDFVSYAINISDDRLFINAICLMIKQNGIHVLPTRLKDGVFKRLTTYLSENYPSTALHFLSLIIRYKINDTTQIGCISLESIFKRGIPDLYFFMDYFKKVFL